MHARHPGCKLVQPGAPEGRKHKTRDLIHQGYTGSPRGLGGEKPPHKHIMRTGVQTPWKRFRYSDGTQKLAVLDPCSRVTSQPVPRSSWCLIPGHLGRQSGVQQARSEGGGQHGEQPGVQAGGRVCAAVVERHEVGRHVRRWKPVREQMGRADRAEWSRCD